MSSEYGFDKIDGHDVPQLVISKDYVLVGTHNGTVHVEAGQFTLQGTLQGTLDIQPGVKCYITGKQQGTVTIGDRAVVSVAGAIQGTTRVNRGASLIIEAGGKLAGTLSNEGMVVIRGVFGGARTGNGELKLEGDGYIKQPKIRKGVSYYEW